MSRLIELVEQYGEAMAAVGRCDAKAVMAANALLAEIHAAVQELARIEAAARVYAKGWVQDEAEQEECCVSTGQHEAAKELIEALSVPSPISGIWYAEASNVPER